MPSEWIKCNEQLPLDNVLVMTKIDDEQGVRNEQALAFHSNLWWTGEGADAMYVYYTPTHWKALEPNPAPIEVAPIEQLIGTETCTYCGIETECLSLPDDGDAERAACQSCIVVAFAEYWGERRESGKTGTNSSS